MTCHANATQCSIKPPRDYSHVVELKAKSLDIIRGQYPELEDLVDSGSLVVVPRAEDYVERRTDGYREPEIVFLIGTSHISQTSAKDVERVIRAVEPENVVVELCQSRSSVMYAGISSTDGRSGDADDRSGDDDGRSSTTSSTVLNAVTLLDLGGSDFASALLRSLRIGGQTALILRYMLRAILSNVSDELGITFGMEFQAARRAALDVDAQIVLGDRPIEITLERAWNSLPFAAKIQLIQDFVRGWSRIKQYESKEAAMEIMERLKQDENAIDSLLFGLQERYEELNRVLVLERDLYLAWSLKRSKAVNGCQKVVGVVGKGHLRGVCYALTHNPGKHLRFRDLAGSRKRSQNASPAQIFGRFVVESSIIGVLWWSWTLVHGS